MTPASQLRSLIDGYWTSRAIQVAARLGVAERLGPGPRSCEALAAEVGADAGALRRLLRALASVGVVVETEPGTFALTPMGELLRPGAGSLLPWALSSHDLAWGAWGELLEAIRTGEPVFARVHGATRYEHLAAHPEEAARFDASMALFSAQVAEAVTAAFDFARFREVVDVGGGRGAFLAAILRAAPAARGVLFERPDVAARAEALLRREGLAGRARCAGGDFFEGVPGGADAYVLKDVLHNWDDERAASILARCREAMAPGGRVLVVEPLIRAGNDPDPAKLLDLHMLVMHGGRERTEAELRAVAARAGLRVARIVPAGRACVSELEAAP